MNKFLMVLSALFLGAVSSQATLIVLDISPAIGTALDLGATTYPGDHALELAAPNAVGQPASAATGGEVGAGITYDDVSNLLSYDLAYGSDFGFVDLVGNYTTAHIHGPAAVQFPAPNTGAGVMVGMTHFAGSSANTGRFTGSAVLTAAQEVDLFDNEFYINVHSGFAGGGEIRGQLIAVIPEPSSLVLLGFGMGLLLHLRRVRK